MYWLSEDLVLVAVQSLACESKAEERMARDTMASEFTPPGQSRTVTVEMFIQRILEQCKEVYSRHEAMRVEDFLKDGVYRRAVMEMMEIKVQSLFFWCVMCDQGWVCCGLGWK